MTQPVTTAPLTAGRSACRHDVQRAAIRVRLALTRLLGVAMAGLVLVSGSRWAITGPHLAGDTLFAGGLLLAATGFVGRLWALSHIAGRKKRELVTDGPYAMCRHPLYFFSLVGGFGLALTTGRLAIAAIYVALSAALLPLAVRDEDAFLAERFRDHGRFRAAVPALIPRRLPTASAAHMVDPSTLRPALLETLGFMAVPAVVQAISALQVAGRLPFLFLLP